MNASQAGEGGLAGAVVEATVLPPSNPLLLKEENKFEQTLLVPFQIPGDIFSSIALKGYSTLADLDYFCHKNIEDYCSAKIIQALDHSGANYSYKFIKHLQVIVWRAS